MEGFAWEVSNGLCLEKWSTSLLLMFHWLEISHEATLTARNAGKGSLAEPSGRRGEHEF